MSDLYNAVRCALEKDDRQYLKTIEADLKKRIDAAAKRSTEQLLNELNNTSFCLTRNFAAESYIPTSVRKATKKFCTALRSDTTGNCLYSSVSLVEVGNNSLMELLRILTSIELYLNADFYSQHPCFSSAVEEHAQYFSQSINNLLPLSVSKECLDTGCMKDDLVRQEAILNCSEKKWSSFLCIMGLASVLNRNTFTYYPDCGQQRSKLLFNRMIQPRLTPKKGLDDLHILFCYEGTVTAGKTIQPNHFVPLIFHQQQLKRKSTAACPQVTAKKPRPTLIFQKKVSNPPSNISKFFKVTEKSASKPKEQLNNNKPSTSTNTKPNISKADITPNAPKVESHGTNFDVAMYRDMVGGMNSSEICNLIRNVFKPDKKYSFPKTNGRSFRYEWLDLYPWLCYSPLKDGAFCLSCVLFGDRFPGKALKIKNLFSEPLRRWSGTSYTLKNHAGHGTGGEMGLHACTFPILTSLLSQMSGKAQPIELILDTNLKKEIEDNRKKLAPIVDSVIFCGRLGLPLRGHRDDSKYHPDVGSYSTERVGNFIESLNFRVRAGDRVLEDHLKNCGKNKTYISKTSQNKIIKCVGQVISEQIIQDIKASKFYSIIADEAADSSHKEQMSLVLRFVDINMNIREEFIAFLECRWGLSGEQLAKLILEALNDMTLSIDDCRGQGYDGAGAVSGHINDTQHAF
ncbi:zinc finger MYM-type protein 1-like [Dendronephthya gigantea]|uniref:zinc finger MYM-type protein 1-like n=2 Tax=Dendronephthya gigantea TaxID=151771 RepID=UPI001068E855|nr:zinc finger MYM-type protein 1-like [Dendronephthya gigantea]